MSAPYVYRIRNQQFWLSPSRSVFWEEEKALIVADLHFGKTGHFRKAGLAVPAAVFKEDLQRLFSQIQFFQPGQLIVVGDFFHSRANKELELFLKWRNDMPDLRIELVMGNHDILDPAWYQQSGIRISQPHLAMGQFLFLHDAEMMDGTPQGNSGIQDSPGAYAITGHLHPGIRMAGAGKQSLCFPCFYFGQHFAVLPAFSRFTGVAMISPAKKDSVFAIVGDGVMQIQ